MVSVLFFVFAGLGALIVIFCAFTDPKSLVFVAPIMGCKIFVCIRHGLRLRREKQIRETADYVSVERAMNELAYIGADIEHVLRNLPKGLRLRKRHRTVGFLSGGFRSFERFEIEGAWQMVFIDCIGAKVAGKRISFRFSLL